MEGWIVVEARGLMFLGEDVGRDIYALHLCVILRRSSFDEAGMRRWCCHGNYSRR